MNAMPLVQGAFICEKVLIEKDSVATAVRIVDTLILPKEAFLKGDTPFVVTVLLMLKNGDASGDGQIGFQVKRPTMGTNRSPSTFPVQLGEGGTFRGTSVVLQLPIAPRETGDHLLELLLDDQVLATIPFRLQEADQPNAGIAEPKS